jgi:hypothetical protein
MDILDILDINDMINFYFYVRHSSNLEILNERFDQLFAILKTIKIKDILIENNPNNGHEQIGQIIKMFTRDEFNYIISIIYDELTQTYQSDHVNIVRIFNFCTKPKLIDAFNEFYDEVKRLQQNNNNRKYSSFKYKSLKYVMKTTLVALSPMVFVKGAFVTTAKYLKGIYDIN